MRVSVGDALVIANADGVASFGVLFGVVPHCGLVLFQNGLRVALRLGVIAAGVLLARQFEVDVPGARALIDEDAWFDVPMADGTGVES